eukprot:XP_011684028.1 PREDICTED: short transient receptor potential channel 4-like [Strongylocentrotus purpuratus]
MSFAFYQVFASTSNLRLVLMTSLLVIAYPFISVVFLAYQGDVLTKLLRTPHIKLWMSFGSDVTLLICVALNSILDKQDYTYPILCVHVVILVHCIGLVWKHVQEIFSRGFIKFIKYYMNVAEVLIVTLCFGFVTSDWIGRVQHDDKLQRLEVETNLTSQCTSWSCAEWNNPVIVSNALCGLVVILCVFRTFHSVVTSYHAIFVIWKSTIGAIRDLVRFSAILGGVLVSVAVGMNAMSLSEFYAQPSQCRNGLAVETCSIWDERFITLPKSMSTLYWALFAVRGQTVRQSFGDDTVFALIYYVFFAAYFILAVVLGLNLFIAIMTSQLTKVQKNSDMEWKFGRAQLWLRVIEPVVELPPPFNLIPKSGTVQRMIKRWIGRETLSREEDEERPGDPERESMVLIHKLLERYQDQKRESTPSCCGFTIEDFRILKENFLSLRNHISKILRLIEMSIESLEVVVEGLNIRIGKLNDTDTQLDGIDHNRVQIEDDDIDQLTDDVTNLEKCVRHAMARLQSTSLITQMAEMYSQGRTVVNDDEARGKLESYRQDFDSYATNLYA